MASVDMSRQLAANVDPYVLDQRINVICAEFDSRGIGPGQREELLIQLLAGALTREGWERIYLLIFGSQMRLLQILNQTPGGLPEHDIRSVYEAGASDHRDLYKAITFESWMSFVETTGLISRGGEKLLITPYGRGFLKYLVGQGLPFERFG
jgi:hypothetical protein